MTKIMIFKHKPDKKDKIHVKDCLNPVFLIFIRKIG